MAAHPVRISFNLAKPELRAKEAVRIHPAVNATLLHDLDVGNGIIIPKGERVLVQPFDEAAADLKGETLKYNIYIIKKLPSGELPEDKRNIEVEAIHFVEVENHYHNRPMIIQMPTPFPPAKTTPEGVRTYLNKSNFSLGSTAIVRSPLGNSYYYVDPKGKITELSMLQDLKDWLKANFFSKQKKQLSEIEARSFYDQFECFSHFGYIEYYGTAHKKAPIFPTPDSPCLDDICQKLVPNCFLLAAMQSILNYRGGQEFIKGMMTDNGDGTVNVRLFDPETLAPCFVRVAKGALAEGESPLNRHKALWVHILETAYVALGRKTEKQVGASAAAVFTNGGHTEFALKILTGKESEYNFIPLKTEEVEAPSFMVFENFDSIIAMHSAYENIPDYKDNSELVDNLIKMAIQGIFSDVVFIDGKLKYDPKCKVREMSDESIEAAKKLLDFYKNNSEKYQEILMKGISMPEKVKELLALLIEKKADKQIIDLFCSIIPVPFSGVYNETAVNVYRKIEDNLSQGNLVTVGSRSREEFDNTGFEPLPGIPCRHGYSVHAVCHRKEIIDNEERTIFYVRLRNPWGRMGREYVNTNGEITGREGDDPVSHVELNEFITAMDRVVVTEIDDFFYFNRVQAQLREILNENGFEFNANMANDGLLKNKKTLDRFCELFFHMEMLHLSYVSKDVSKKIQSILDEEKNIDLQRDKILRLLNDNPQNIPFYVGENENKNFYLLKLFKLKEALNDKNSDLDYVGDLKRQIIELSGYIFDQKLIDAQAQFNTIYRSKISDFNSKMQFLRLRLNSVLQEIEKFKEDAENFLIFKNGMMETNKNFLKEIADLKRVLEELGYILSAKQKETFGHLVADIELYAQNSTSRLINTFEEELIAIEKCLSTLGVEENQDLEPSEYEMKAKFTLENIKVAISNCMGILDDLVAAQHPCVSDMQKRLDELYQKMKEWDESFSQSKIKEGSSNGQNKFGFHSAKASPSRETPKHLNHFSGERYRYGNHR